MIIICRSGNRSTYAAQRLENIGYTDIYEVDNEIKEYNSETGGRGGVQGTSYSSSFGGYRGYPGRLPAVNGGYVVHKATETNAIQSENDSVAWMDLGLPVTQKINSSMYLRIENREINNTVSLQPNSNYSYLNYNNSLTNNYTQTFSTLLNNTLSATNTMQFPALNNYYQSNSLFSNNLPANLNFNAPFTTTPSSCSGDFESLYSPSLDLQPLKAQPDLFALKPISKKT